MNGQDLGEPKAKIEDSSVVTGLVEAAQVESAARLITRTRADHTGPFDPLHVDVWIYRIVVATLGAVLIIATVGGLVIAMAGKGPVPDVVVALGSGSVGALAGLLAPSPGHHA